MTKRGWVALMPLLFLILQAEASEVIPVRSQEEFESLPRVLETAMLREEAIRVEFGPGTFFFGNDYLSLNGLECAGKELVLTGNGTRLVAEGEGNAVFSPDDGWVDLARDADFSRMGPTRTALFYPVPSLLHRGRFRLRVREPDLSEEEASDVYLVLTQWFQGALYKVRKISRGVAHLERVGEHPTAWYTELRFGRCLPRYRMVNHPADRPTSDLHRCLASTFCRLEDCLVRFHP